MENDTTNDPVAAEADENYARYAETMGGRMRINWDSRIEMSTNAHHVLFGEFLALSGLFDHLVETAPLVYTSPNRPEKRDVIGTAVLGIVDCLAPVLPESYILDLGPTVKTVSALDRRTVHVEPLNSGRSGKIT